jgi:hypothetical protein
MKRLLVAGLTGAMLLSFLALPAVAAPSNHTNFGANLNASQCNSNGSPVLNITFKVTKDADSGTLGNVWAFDNYNKKVQVWPQSDGTFCAVVKYEGKFVTLAGPSPQAATTGGTVGAGVTGTFEGGYIASFDGTLNSGLKTKGNIGTFNFDCDTSYNCPGLFDWVSVYFSGNSYFNQPYWAWNYHGSKNGSWVNASTGNSGDITGN